MKGTLVEIVGSAVVVGMWAGIAVMTTDLQAGAAAAEPARLQAALAAGASAPLREALPAGGHGRDDAAPAATRGAGRDGEAGVRSRAHRGLGEPQGARL